jgi:hypothetical protein
MFCDMIGGVFNSIGNDIRIPIGRRSLDLTENLQSRAILLNGFLGISTLFRSITLLNEKISLQEIIRCIRRYDGGNLDG